MTVALSGICDRKFKYPNYLIFVKKIVLQIFRTTLCKWNCVPHSEHNDISPCNHLLRHNFIQFIPKCISCYCIMQYQSALKNSLLSTFYK